MQGSFTDSLIFLRFFHLYQRKPALCHFWMNVHAHNCQFVLWVYISEPTSVIPVRCLFSCLIMNTYGIVHFIARVMEFRLKCLE